MSSSRVALLASWDCDTTVSSCNRGSMDNNLLFAKKPRSTQHAYEQLADTTDSGFHGDLMDVAFSVPTKTRCAQNVAAHTKLRVANSRNTAVWWGISLRMSMTAERESFRMSVEHSVIDFQFVVEMRVEKAIIEF